MGHTYRGGKSGGELLTLFGGYSYDGVSARAYTMLILGIFLAYLGHRLGVYWAHFWAYLGHIWLFLGITW